MMQLQTGFVGHAKVKKLLINSMFMVHNAENLFCQDPSNLLKASISQLDIRVKASRPEDEIRFWGYCTFYYSTTHTQVFC